MSLPDLWFVLIAVLWTGFFVLEGFDFGVGMLHAVVSRSDAEQRVAINSIGPFWDGNEVWLVVAGGRPFAALPPSDAAPISARGPSPPPMLRAPVAPGGPLEVPR